MRKAKSRHGLVSLEMEMAGKRSLLTEALFAYGPQSKMRGDLRNSGPHEMDQANCFSPPNSKNTDCSGISSCEDRVESTALHIVSDNREAVVMKLRKINMETSD